MERHFTFENVPLFFFLFLLSTFCFYFNDHVNCKIFGDDITGFRSTISVDRPEKSETGMPWSVSREVLQRDGKTFAATAQ